MLRQCKQTTSMINARPNERLRTNGGGSEVVDAGCPVGWASVFSFKGKSSPPGCGSICTCKEEHCQINNRESIHNTASQHKEEKKGKPSTNTSTPRI